MLYLTKYLTVKLLDLILYIENDLKFMLCNLFCLIFSSLLIICSHQVRSILIAFA